MLCKLSIGSEFVHEVEIKRELPVGFRLHGRHVPHGSTAQRGGYAQLVRGWPFCQKQDRTGRSGAASGFRDFVVKNRRQLLFLRSSESPETDSDAAAVRHTKYFSRDLFLSALGTADHCLQSALDARVVAVCRPVGIWPDYPDSFPDMAVICQLQAQSHTGEEGFSKDAGLT